MAVCSEIHTKHINTLCGQNVQFLDPFAKSRKAIISSVMSVRPPASNNSAPTGRMFTKFDDWAFCENLPRKFKLH